MEINLGELIEVVIDLKTKPDFELARIKWIFSSGTIIRGGRVTQSKKNPETPWVQLPKYRAGNGSWPHTIELPEDLRKYLENRALEQYLLKQMGDTPPDDANELEINLDDLNKYF